MKTFNFKGYVYNLETLPSKEKFDEVYHGLLRKANNGGSIVKDLEKAYQVGSGSVYIIRYDKVKRALIPVRIARESVDGSLIRKRYDARDDQLKAGIGAEFSRMVKEEYNSLHAAKASRNKHDSHDSELEKVVVNGTNYFENVRFHFNICQDAMKIFEKSDINYRNDREYKMKVDKHLHDVVRLYDDFDMNITLSLRDPGANIHAVRQIIPDDIDQGAPPSDLLKLLEIYYFLTVFNDNVEKEWISMRDYTIKLDNLPVRLGLHLEKAFKIIEETKRLLISLEKIINPANHGQKRAENISYDILKFNEVLIDILAPKRG